MKKSLLFSFIAVIIVWISVPSCWNRGKAPVGDAAAEMNDTVYPLGFCTDSFDIEDGKLKNGEIFSGLMTRLGLGTSEAYELTKAVDSTFDVRKLRAGNTWQAYYDPDSTGRGQLRYLVYNMDRVNMTVFRCTRPYEAWKVSKPVEIQRRYLDVTIKSSLWNDMTASGNSPLLIVTLSDIYAWTVDFFGLQKGDRFRAIYEQKVCEGDIIGIEGVDYAVFNRDDKELQAIRYDTGDGGNVYWNEKGESMKKAFLKAPLKFTRVSSGFSYHRKHPVHGTVRPHTGVDYAAPTGTPVMSIGDGTVISKGWGGGGGNTVKIRHNSVYTTAYLHLSRYANIKVGDRVSQGQVIGYVGMTGTATGPHLDFRVWKNGSPINPLKMESPSAEPLAEEFRPALDSTLALRRQELDSLSRTQLSY